MRHHFRLKNETSKNTWRLWVTIWRCRRKSER
jgi:hypothetical protein